jgi:hypothetical protein
LVLTVFAVCIGIGKQLGVWVTSQFWKLIMILLFIQNAFDIKKWLSVNKMKSQSTNRTFT